MHLFPPQACSKHNETFANAPTYCAATALPISTTISTRLLLSTAWRGFRVAPFCFPFSCYPFCVVSPFFFFVFVCSSSFSRAHDSLFLFLGSPTTKKKAAKQPQQQKRKKGNEKAQKDRQTSQPSSSSSKSVKSACALAVFAGVFCCAAFCCSIQIRGV